MRDGERGKTGLKKGIDDRFYPCPIEGNEKNKIIVD
jgi:hypothetical protein